jgi:RNA polymerase-binding transcription factor
MITPKFLRQTRERLLKRRDALRGALAGDQTLLRSLTLEGVGDEIDAAVVSEQAELRSQLAQVESRELARIDQALDKIRKSKYGRCETCDRPISPLRLKYVPYATDCIACARKHEHREERRGVTGGRAPVNRIAGYDLLEDEPTVESAELEVT